jgi:hypothetical protein
MLKNWRHRYIVLDAAEATVRWYKAEDSHRSQGELQLLGAPHETALMITEAHRPRLSIRVGRRELVLEAEDQVAAKAWRDAVQAVLDRSRGLTGDLISQPTSPPLDTVVEALRCVLL